jgi:hypothetical protein
LIFSAPTQQLKREALEHEELEVGLRVSKKNSYSIMVLGRANILLYGNATFELACIWESWITYLENMILTKGNHGLKSVVSSGGRMGAMATLQKI